jgi:hypothetical protein
MDWLTDEGVSNRGRNANCGLGRERLHMDEGLGGGRQGVSWGRALNVTEYGDGATVEFDDVDDVGDGGVSLHEYVSGSRGRRLIGTLFKNCACGRLHIGSGVCGAVGSDRWISFNSSMSLQ